MLRFPDGFYWGCATSSHQVEGNNRNNQWWAWEQEPPFDTEREKREPAWGDPTFRRISREVKQGDIGACHLHTNNRDVLADMNIALPVQRFLELESEGIIGSLAPTSYSFMGFQMNTTEWKERYAPEAAALMKGEGVDAVILTPF